MKSRCNHASRKWKVDNWKWKHGKTGWVGFEPLGISRIISISADIDRDIADSDSRLRDNAEKHVKPHFITNYYENLDISLQSSRGSSYFNKSLCRCRSASSSHVILLTWCDASKWRLIAPCLDVLTCFDTLTCYKWTLMLQLSQLAVRWWRRWCDDDEDCLIWPLWHEDMEVTCVRKCRQFDEEPMFVFL